MIEINLLQKKKKAHLPVVLGLDLNLLNFKLVVFALFFSWIADMVSVPIFKSSENEVRNNIKQLNASLKKINDEMRDNEKVKAKLQAYNKKFERLKRRSAQVDTLIKQRTNPKKLLEKIARDIPDDLWFDRLEITEDRKIFIDGGAEEYTSIGRFIIQAKEALFFGANFVLKKTETIEDKIMGKGRRVEHFSVEGSIKTFDPWNE